jgi:hypothetical protein
MDVTGFFGIQRDGAGKLPIIPFFRNSVGGVDGHAATPAELFNLMASISFA